MNNKRNRRIALVIAVLMLTMAFSSTGFAAWMGKTVETQYRNITIWVNSELKQARDANGVVVEPFIVNGTTYVPLRGISQMLGYEVNFNPATYRIDITGTGSDPSLQYQLYLKDARIAELEAQLADKTGDLSVIEKELLKDYDYIGDVVVESIILKGDEDDIEVRIYVDLYHDEDEWDDLDEDDIEDYLQDIVDELLDNFSNADITGYIEDDDSNDKLVEFEIDSRDNVVLEGFAKIEDADDLEDELISKYGSYYRNFDFDFYVVSETKTKITIDILVDKGYIDDLSNTNIRNLLTEVSDFIIKNYKDLDVEGEVWDGLDLILFDYDGKTLDWDFD